MASLASQCSAGIKGSLMAPGKNGVAGESSRSSCLRSDFLGSPGQLALTQAHLPISRRQQSHRPFLSVPFAKVREIFMPALSSTMTEGKIVAWSKSEGDQLSKGESVVVVESDKADMDVETFYDGILAAILVDEGAVAPVGAAIALLAETEEELEEARAKAAAVSGGGAAAPAPAAPVAATATAVEAAPASAATAMPAPVAAAPSANRVVSQHPASKGGSRIVATPYAKKLGRDLGIDLFTVLGSGPNGRIVAADVERTAAAPPPAAAPALDGAWAAAPAPSSAPMVAAAGPTSPPPGVSYTVVPFTPMQAAVARNMVASLAVPVSRVGYKIVTNQLDDLQKKLKSKGVTTTVLLAKAVALALAQHPIMNASCPDGNSFHYSQSINIAVAVAMDGGLITPVLQDADKTDIFSLSAKWRELVDKARAKKLSPAEYSGGTFTLSNLGMFGVDRFDAILPPGTGAIMAVGASLPVVLAKNDNSFAVRRQMQVNVTADHRIIYGADVAEFLKTLSSIVENPDQLTQ